MWETWVPSLGWMIPWSRDRLPTPVFWPGEFHGLYSPWGRKVSDTTEQLSLSFFTNKMGFPDSSVAKESACNAGDPGSIPGSGRSSGEGIGYPLQYCWGSLMAQLVRNPPVMQETWVQSLGWEDTLEKGKASHSSVVAWRIP